MGASRFALMSNANESACIVASVQPGAYRDGTRGTPRLVAVLEEARRATVGKAGREIELNRVKVNRVLILIENCRADDCAALNGFPPRGKRYAARLDTGTIGTLFKDVPGAGAIAKMQLNSANHSTISEAS